MASITLLSDKFDNGDPYTIRVIEDHDIHSCLNIYNYYVNNSAITFATKEPSIEEFSALVNDTKCSFPFLVVASKGKILGYTYAHQLGSRGAFCHSVELSIYLSHNVRTLGLGSKLYEVMERLLVQQGILNLYASIATPVDKEDEYLTCASLKFHQKLGFKVVGTLTKCGYKFGRFYNLTWAEKLIAPHQNYEAPERTPPRYY